MQHPVTQRIVVRACSLVALATLASAALAAPEQAVDAHVAEARSLFRGEFGISAGQATPQARQDGAAGGSANLEQQRGGTDTWNDQTLKGNVAGNSAMNVVTGNNTIDAGSFANMSGIPVVIQNSGANVLIQNATIINLQMK